jgi:hypothetical protein
MISGRSLLFYQFMRRVIKLIVIIIVRHHCCQVHTKFYQTSFSQGYVHIQTKLLGIISLGFNVTDQLLIRFSVFVRYWRKSESTIIQYISHSFIHFKKAYDTVKRKVLYNILIYFWGTNEICPAD